MYALAVSGNTVYLKRVNAVAIGSGVVYAGGPFTSIGGTSRNGLAALDAGTGAATPWNAAPVGTTVNGGIVRALAVSASRIVARGSFTDVGGRPRHGVAAFAP